MAEFTITSSAFSSGDSIPSKYSCDGEDVSPPLGWENSPANTESFALIMDDPDAPARTWVHWVIFNIPADVRRLSEGASPGGALPGGAREGQNSWNRNDYGGPCPPGGTHRYFFKLYALERELDLQPGASKKEVLNAMEGGILAQAELVGLYSRQ